MKNLVVILCLLLFTCRSDKHEALKFEVLKQTNQVIEDEISGNKNAMLKKLEVKPELAQMFKEPIKSIETLRSKVTANDLKADNSGNLTFKFYNKIDYLTREVKFFADFDKSILDNRKVEQGKYTNENEAILLSNVFGRNKLKLMEYCLVKLVGEVLPSNESVKVSHITEGGQTKIVVQFEIPTYGEKTVKIRNRRINGKNLPDDSVVVFDRKQIVHIALGDLPKGKHHYNAILNVVRDNLPVSYTIDYEFEL